VNLTRSWRRARKGGESPGCLKRESAAAGRHSGTSSRISSREGKPQQPLVDFGWPGAGVRLQLAEASVAILVRLPDQLACTTVWWIAESVRRFARAGWHRQLPSRRVCLQDRQGGFLLVAAFPPRRPCPRREAGIGFRRRDSGKVKPQPRR